MQRLHTIAAVKLSVTEETLTSISGPRKWLSYPDRNYPLGHKLATIVG